MIKFYVCCFYLHIRSFSSWGFIHFVLIFCWHRISDVFFWASSSLNILLFNLSLSFLLTFGPIIEAWSFWVFSTPFQSLFPLITSQWESCALYSFWAHTGASRSIFCTFTLLYTNITALNLSKLLPTGWLWRFHSYPIIFFILFFIIFICSLTTSRPIAPILHECGATVTKLSYYIIWSDHCNLLHSEFSTCLVNDQPLACNALICAIGSLWLGRWVLFIDLVLSTRQQLS